MRRRNVSGHENKGDCGRRQSPPLPRRLRLLLRLRRVRQPLRLQPLLHRLRRSQLLRLSRNQPQLRSAWLTTRTSRLNALRGALREFGVVVPLGAKHVLPAVAEALGSEAVPAALGESLTEVCGEIRELERRIRSTERQLQALTNELPVVQRLRTIPGIGLLTATALVAVIGDARRFPSGGSSTCDVRLSRTPRFVSPQKPLYPPTLSNEFTAAAWQASDAGPCAHPPAAPPRPLPRATISSSV